MPPVRGSEANPSENITDFDKLRGQLTIYDPVANSVVDPLEMVFDDVGKRLVYIWNGQNRSNRNCSSGAHLILVNVKHTFKGKRLADTAMKEMVIIK